MVKRAEPKAQVTIRLDREVLDWFKSQGKGYQSRINASSGPTRKPVAGLRLFHKACRNHRNVVAIGPIYSLKSIILHVVESLCHLKLKFLPPPQSPASHVLIATKPKTAFVIFITCASPPGHGKNHRYSKNQGRFRLEPAGAAHLFSGVRRGGLTRPYTPMTTAAAINFLK